MIIDNYNQTVLLMKSNTAIVDESIRDKVITNNGVVTDYSIKRFESASLRFDGSSYATIPHDSDFTFTNGEEVIQTFFYISADSVVDGDGGRNATLLAGSTNDYFGLIVGGDTSITGTSVSFYANVGGVSYGESIMTTLAKNQWHFVRVSWDASQLSINLNGNVSVFSALPFILNLTSNLSLGKLDGQNQYYYRYFNGNIDYLQIVNGVSNHSVEMPENILYSGTITEPYVSESFKIRAHRVNNGVLLAETISIGGTYSLSVNSSSPIIITATADQGTVRVNSHAYLLGDKCFLEDTIATPYYYKCTQAGTSAATEPVFPTTENEQVTDGTVIWECVEQLIKPICEGPFNPISGTQ